MTKEVEFVIGRNFNGHALKNISLITNIVNPSKHLNKAYVASRRIPVDDYPPFSKEESKEVLEIYITNSDHSVDVYSQSRKKEV